MEDPLFWVSPSPMAAFLILSLRFHSVPPWTCRARPSERTRASCPGAPFDKVLVGPFALIIGVRAPDWTAPFLPSPDDFFFELTPWVTLGFDRDLNSLFSSVSFRLVGWPSLLDYPLCASVSNNPPLEFLVFCPGTPAFTLSRSPYKDSDGQFDFFQLISNVSSV